MDELKLLGHYIYAVVNTQYKTLYDYRITKTTTFVYVLHIIYTLYLTFLSRKEIKALVHAERLSPDVAESDYERQKLHSTENEYHINSSIS